jgi:hypothetical protein
VTDSLCATERGFVFSFPNDDDDDEQPERKIQGGRVARVVWRAKLGGVHYREQSRGVCLLSRYGSEESLNHSWPLAGFGITVDRPLTNLRLGVEFSSDLTAPRALFYHICTLADNLNQSVKGLVK